MSFLTVRGVKQQYDLIHVHSVPDFEVFATLVPKLLGSRIILDIHDIVPEFYASKFKVGEGSFVFRLLVLIEKLSATYCDHVIVSNDLWMTRLTERSVPKDKCSAIINYPDLSIFYERPRGEGPDFLMCYPGTLNHHQGVDVAIRAMSLLRDKAPQVKFLIVGDGPDREKLKVMIEQEGLGHRVFMKGLVSMEVVAAIMAQVDLGVVPKRKSSFGNEAFSTKIMEFMAMGVPVIAANTKIDEFYFNENLVQFFESDCAEDLADKIIALARNPSRRNMLRENARRYICQNNWDVKKQCYIDLIDQILTGKATEAIAS